MTNTETPEPLTPERIFELEVMLAKMHEASDTFYGLAQRTRCHPFIEFTGLMNEYIKVCRSSLGRGIDFAEANTHNGLALHMEQYEAAYLAEKFECIFGPTMRAHPKVHATFARAIGLKS